MRSTLSFEDLLKAKVHLGHKRKYWNPKMAPFLFGERKGMHIIDLNKTLEGIKNTSASLKNIVESGRKVLFVATKRQASDLVKECAKKLDQPYVTHRWLGGTLTNFSTIKRSLKKLANIDKIKTSETYQNLAKKEKLTLERSQANLGKLLKGLMDINRLPSALFVIDARHEDIAIKEARKLGIPVFGLVDTNSDPTLVDYIIPGNDDSRSSIKVILDSIMQAVQEGLENRQKNKDLTKDKKIEPVKSVKEDNKKPQRKSPKPSGRIIKKVASTDKINTNAANDITSKKKTSPRVVKVNTSTEGKSDKSK